MCNASKKQKSRRIARAGASPDTRIPRDSFTSACAQACPTEAIVFGDIKDPESRVSKMKQQDRNYRILDYLNIDPASQLSGADSQSEPENARCGKHRSRKPGGEIARMRSSVIRN